ncbi:MAG: helix-turn-helix domain-containing protein [Micromonosporaceae bacterium]|nr:helix-turn-helix domain-containing protein [Micromonosporaceae bacterium]
MSRHRMVWAERGRNLLLTLVVVAPIALSAQNIVGWAQDPTGLGLSRTWSYAVFFALDAAAGVCVLMTLILAARGDKPGAFGPLVWVFACTSAFAGYRHGDQPGAPDDAWWFFPLMSVLGPMLLHLVLGHVRRDAQIGDQRRLTYATASAYRLGRWIPGVGAFAETYCAWRVGRLEGITTPAEAIDRYRQLCPNGQWRVLKAMRMESARVRTLTATGGQTVDTSTDMGADTVPPAKPVTPGSTTGTPMSTSVDTVVSVIGDSDCVGIPALTAAPVSGSTDTHADTTPGSAADIDHGGGRPKPRVRRTVSTAEQVTRMRRRNPAITVTTMAQRLNVSERTIRRYLTADEQDTKPATTPINGTPVSELVELI